MTRPQHQHGQSRPTPRSALPPGRGDRPYAAVGQARSVRPGPGQPPRHDPPAGPVPKTRPPERRLPTVAVRYLLLLVLAIFFLMPIYLLVAGAIRDPTQAKPTGIWQLPTALSLENFRAVIPELGSGFGNSLIIAVPASIIAAVLGSANGFVLAKWRFPKADLIFPLILFGIFVPYQAVLIPVVRTMTAAGMRGASDPTGGLRGLVLVHIIYGLPITTLIFRNFFASLPESLLEASQVDGAGLLRVYFDIAVPLAKPAFAVAIIWQFTAVWNDFLFGAVMTTRNSWPITIALNNIAGGQSVPVGQAMAGALLACIPTVTVYLLLGKYFLKGAVTGTLQG